MSKKAPCIANLQLLTGGAVTINANGQNSSVLSGTIIFGGNSQGAVNVATYTIIPSGQTSPSYAINYVNGTLTINPAPITLTFNPPSITVVLDSLAATANIAGTTSPSTVMNATVLPTVSSLPGNPIFGGNTAVLPYGNDVGAVGGSANQQTSNTSTTNQQTSNATVHKRRQAPENAPTGRPERFGSQRRNAYQACREHCETEGSYAAQPWKRFAARRCRGTRSWPRAPVGGVPAGIRPEDRRDENTMTAMRKKAGMPNPTDKHVGSRVRLRRVMLNLSQPDLASRLGISYQQLQKYERGANRMGASRDVAARPWYLHIKGLSL